jgi:propionyl-CoA synthetase
MLGSTMRRFSTFQGFSKYKPLYDYSINPATRNDFWAKCAERIQWAKNPTQILDETRSPFYKWFADGELNITESCVDRWARKTPNNLALIYEGRIAGKKETWNFAQLHKELELFAGVLKKHGVKRGDRVVIYMPMINLAVCAMLACARIGAVHSVVFGGFAPKELASRITDSGANIILSASCGIEPHKTIDYAKNIRESVRGIGREDIKRIYVDREEMPLKSLEKNEYFYREERESVRPQEAVHINSNDPLYILYTSGSTGTPKGVLRDAGGTAVALSNSLELAFDLGEGDVCFASTDLGWVVGHTFTYGPLLNGCATVLYEGKPNTGHPGVYWELMDLYKIKAFYTSPTAMRFLRREDPEGLSFKKWDVSSLKYFGIVGERTDLHTFKWIRDILPEGCTYNDTYWQTETGHVMSGNFAKPEVLDPTPGCCIKPYPGWDIRVLDEQGKQVENGKLGYIVSKLPNPPSFMSSLWNNEQAFVDKYMVQYPGYYMTGDMGYFDAEQGYLHISTRIDDVINTAGHRLSTSQIEESILGHDTIGEVAVVAANDELKGEVPIAYVTLKKGVTIDEKVLAKELAALVRKDIGPVASFSTTIVLNRLPKNKSGKVLRGVMKKMMNGESYTAPATIDNPGSIPEVMQKMLDNGFGVKRDIEFDATALTAEQQKVIEDAEANAIFGDQSAAQNQDKGSAQGTGKSDKESRLDHMI